MSARLSQLSHVTAVPKGLEAAERTAASQERELQQSKRESAAFLHLQSRRESAALPRRSARVAGRRKSTATTRMDPVPSISSVDEHLPPSIPSGKERTLTQDLLLMRSGAATAAFQALRHRAKFIIDPRTSKAIPKWDATTSLALIFTALVTPFEVGFLPGAMSAAESLFLVNRIVDLVFLVDVALQFFLMQPIGEGREGSRWVTEPRLIARRYLRGWFAIDVLSIAVSFFDYLSLNSPAACPGETAGISSLKALRVLRALRLIKLVRLLRASRMLRRWEVRVAVNYGLLSVVSCVVGVVMISHWFACIWGLQASVQDDLLATWEGEDGLYCRNVTEDGLGAFDRTSSCEVQCAGPAVLYAAALHWAVMALLGEAAATAGNTTEQVVATILMLVGSMAWSQVLATFVSVVSTLSPARAEFCGRMDELNAFMSRQELPIEMRRRLREYFHQTEHLRLASKQRELIAMMSLSLQAEVAWSCNRHWLQRVYFLKDAPLPFLVQLAQQLRALVFAPGESAPPGRLYIISRGLAMHSGKMLGPGKVWGEEVIITPEHHLDLREISCARALNFLEVFAMDRSDLESISSYFPEFAASMRKLTVRVAMRRAFIKRAKQILRERHGIKERIEHILRLQTDSSVILAAPGPEHAVDALRKEVHRQGARQEELVSAIQGLTLAVEALTRRDHGDTSHAPPLQPVVGGDALPSTLTAAPSMAGIVTGESSQAPFKGAGAVAGSSPQEDQHRFSETQRIVAGQV